MMNTISRQRILVTVCIGLLLLIFPLSSWGAGKKLNICAQINKAQLKQLNRKQLYSTATSNGCYWSETPGGMASLDISIHKVRRPLRDYYNKNLPSGVKLEKISGIGDKGLVNVSEGTLGVVVIRKGKMVLQSAVTFLDVKPGSKKQAVLWDIYKHIVDKL